MPCDPTSSRHRSKPLTFFTVGPPALHDLARGGDVAGLQQHVAHRPVAQAADAAAADGERPADRAARRQGHALAELGQRGVELVDGRAGAAAHDHLVGLDPVDAGRRAARGARRRPGPPRVPSPVIVTGPSAPTSLGERRQIHAPSGTCCTSPHDAGDGSTLSGLASPVGVERPAQRGLRVEVGRR